MEVFIISTAAIGIVVVAYAVSLVRQIIERREADMTSRPSKSMAFLFPAREHADHPVFGGARYDLSDR